MARSIGQRHEAQPRRRDQGVARFLCRQSDRLARFQREAQLLGSLNHPNIAAIYGLEDRAMVLELVEGPTLADRIAQGPMPVEEALTIARQIADALEYSHEKSIIHRDLKPANVKVTPDGRIRRDLFI
jgi:eukaryotic-like serine/threonine-protein kinase